MVRECERVCVCVRYLCEFQKRVSTNRGENSLSKRDVSAFQNLAIMMQLTAFCKQFCRTCIGFDRFSFCLCFSRLLDCFLYLYNSLSLVTHMQLDSPLADVFLHIQHKRDCAQILMTRISMTQ